MHDFYDSEDEEYNPFERPKVVNLSDQTSEIAKFMSKMVGMPCTNTPHTSNPIRSTPDLNTDQNVLVEDITEAEAKVNPSNRDDSVEKLYIGTRQKKPDEDERGKAFRNSRPKRKCANYASRDSPVKVKPRTKKKEKATARDVTRPKRSTRRSHLKRVGPLTDSH